MVRKKKILEYTTKHLYGSNRGPSGARPSWTLVPCFEPTWYKITWQCYIPNIKHLSQVVLENILKYISFLNPRPPSQGHFRPQGHYLYKLSRSLLGNATYQTSGLYAYQFKRKRSLKQIVDDARRKTHGGRRTLTMAIAHPDPMVILVIYLYKNR